MRGAGTFEIRTAFMCIIASIFYIWQILEIKQKRREELRGTARGDARGARLQGYGDVSAFRDEAADENGSGRA